MDKVYNIGNQIIEYFSPSTESKLVQTNDFNIVPPFPYSYHTQTLQYGITGPFQLSSGTIYATRINRSVTLSFNGVSLTGNNNSSVINFPQLPSEYTISTTNINSFPVDVIQAGITTPGRLYINGNNMSIGPGNCTPFTGSNLLQGYLSFNITYIDSQNF